ncbi:MAG: 6,7-dimethyl-8-ribityllumazine synthase [Bacteroidia bacterium]|nr:6,7-dimethyl-8-ribityllumazine synthase [Bacteroidia bacterium]
MGGSQGHDLSHIRYTGGKNHSHDRIAIVVSKWNDKITETLFSGAKDTLLAAGVPAAGILRRDVPGSFELPTGAQFALDSINGLDAVICLGCVIQGETRHFEFINQAVAQGVTQVSLKYNRPVIFGVLTPDTQQQAEDRAGGKYGNKGEEAAVAALDMIDLHRLDRD